MKYLFPAQLVFSLILLTSLATTAQPQPDHLLDQMVGKYHLTGDMLGKPLDQDVDVHWVLRDQFLEFSFTSPAHAQVPYEARMWVGRDEEGYVAHLLDQFGAEPSRTLGFGQAGPTLVLLFAYPTAEFRQTFRSTTTGWTIEIDSRKPGKEWIHWATKVLTRVP